MRERGLKSPYNPSIILDVTSLPVRERGLKYTRRYCALPNRPVAPRAGAWIEVCHVCHCRHHKGSLPVRERGLKYDSEQPFQSPR